MNVSSSVFFYSSTKQATVGTVCAEILPTVFQRGGFLVDFLREFSRIEKYNDSGNFLKSSKRYLTFYSYTKASYCCEIINAFVIEITSFRQRLLIQYEYPAVTPPIPTQVRTYFHQKLFQPQQILRNTVYNLGYRYNQRVDTRIVQGDMGVAFIATPLTAATFSTPARSISQDG